MIVPKIAIGFYKDLLDELNCADECEARTAFCSLVDSKHTITYCLFNFI
ncbi:hypothetical protein [Ruminobacter sp.]